MEIGDIVYIKKEYIDHLNPLLGDENDYNHKPWKIVDKYKMDDITNMINISIKERLGYTIQSGPYTIRCVLEYQLVSLSEERDKKIRQIVS